MIITDIALIDNMAEQMFSHSPNCLEVYDDNHGFCSNCGSRLVDDVE